MIYGEFEYILYTKNSALLDTEKICFFFSVLRIGTKREVCCKNFLSGSQAGNSIVPTGGLTCSFLQLLNLGQAKTRRFIDKPKNPDSTHFYLDSKNRKIEISVIKDKDRDRRKHKKLFF